ncbi:MAG: methionyl-tRNA formyltransferase [Candidatus Diapherotrites archaeon]|uniref:Methionyl-tRNA formyltransferase n=1 Tax=Candidatus Iainarchaeum sp. TaxID=3101447 RepID=A0A938YWD2_9ARCH|nr:methionyl-tRNA formyltransferase [Candidatus Diapherotrites archaeon]
MRKGDYLFLLSCSRIYPKEKLRLNRHNLVIHASALPEGRGFAPLSWQVLEGKKSIPVTMFEAAEEVDSGEIYSKEMIELDGSELIDELREKIYGKIESMVLRVLEQGLPQGKEQKGKPTYYRRRTPFDSELDPDKSIAEQFNLLRIADNKRYPAFFKFRGKEYVLHIFKKSIETK